jgi:hypothetical protein
MNGKGILELNIGNFPKDRDEIARILELNDGILLSNDDEVVAQVKTIDIVVCANCKYAVRTKDGNLNPNDIVCSMWCTDGLKAGDYCSRGEEGVYVPDDNCIQDQDGYL